MDKNILTINIKNIKGINELNLELPIEPGVFALVGVNGCGKSTILQVLYQLVRRPNALPIFKENDYNIYSNISFQYQSKKDEWYVKIVNDSELKQIKWESQNLYRNIIFRGMYEGSLFVGMRFQDSRRVAKQIHLKQLTNNDIVDADDYIKNKLSYILHGNYEHYKTLKVLKNKKIQVALNLKNMPYFTENIYGDIISQYRMSSGECLLISLLHFIHNSIIRKSLPMDTPILMLLDEIELALHPVAVSRFLDLLQEIIKEYHNITVILTTHAPEVIRRISPNNIFKLENFNGNVEIVNPCYPSYAIRELYTADKYDCTILCEDELAKIFINKVIKKHKICESKLICVVPVGGWDNVLKLHKEIILNNVLGVGTKVISILDGDIELKCKKNEEYNSIKKLFIPFSNIEQFLLDIVWHKIDKKLRKEINDKYFQLNSLDMICSNIRFDFKENVEQIPQPKTFYRYLIKDLQNRNISEQSFIESLSDDILSNIDYSKFQKSFEKELQ